MRILIVEDNPGMVKMLERTLVKNTYEVDSVATGEEALKKLDSNEYFAVITDYKLPGISGLDVLKAAKAADPQTITIIITAYGTVETAVEAMKSGADDFITKPFDKDELSARLKVGLRITSLEQNWGVDDQAVIAALTESGLTRAVLEREIGRLLSVQAGQDTLRGRGYDTTDWIAKQRAKAEIVIYRNVAVLPPLPTRLPVPTPSSPLPSPAGPFAQVAPDFTLDRAGGGTFTLTEQLAQGPVVLVFFQKCG